MLDAQRRLDVLAAAHESLDREARPAIEALLTEFFADHAEVAAVRWTQSRDPPRADVLVIHDVVIEFARGGRFHADTARFEGARPDALDPLAYALLAALMLGCTDLLVAAFGLDVGVTATPAGVETTPRAA